MCSLTSVVIEIYIQNRKKDSEFVVSLLNGTHKWQKKNPESKINRKRKQVQGFAVCLLVSHVQFYKINFRLWNREIRQQSVLYTNWLGRSAVWSYGSWLRCGTPHFVLQLAFLLLFNLICNHNWLHFKCAQKSK